MLSSAACFVFTATINPLDVPAVCLCGGNSRNEIYKK